MDKKIKQPKVLKVVGNITYLESDYSEAEENKPKRKVSWETRQKLSKKRKAVKKQPRAGQSKKAQNFFSQLKKDYVDQSSAMGKFQRGKGKDDYESEMLKFLFENQEVEEQDILENEVNLTTKDNKDKDGFKLFITITDDHKKDIKQWLSKNKSKLESLGLSEGIMSEYDIMNVNFSQVKMTDNLIENLDLGSNVNNVVNIDYESDILDKEIKNKHDIARYKFISFKEYQYEQVRDILSEYASDLFIDTLYSFSYSEKKINYYSKFYNKVCSGYFNLFFDNNNEEVLLVEDLVRSSHLIILSFIEDKFDSNSINKYLKESRLNIVKATEIRDLLERLDG